MSRNRSGKTARPAITRAKEAGRTALAAQLVIQILITVTTLVRAFSGGPGC